MGAHNLTGTTLLQNGVYSKGTAFSEEERAALHLKGLLPPVPATISMQVEAMMEQLRAFDTPFQKALFLDGLRSSNETLYFRLLLEHIEEVLPLVYTRLSAKSARSSATSSASRRASTCLSKTRAT